MADSRDIDHAEDAMIPWMWNLDKMAQDAEDRALIAPALPNLDGKSNIEVGRELLKRCQDREERFAENAIAAERDGDTEGTWLAMAARAENNRMIERLTRDLKTLEAAAQPTVS